MPRIQLFEQRSQRFGTAHSPVRETVEIGLQRRNTCEPSPPSILARVFELFAIEFVRELTQRCFYAGHCDPAFLAHHERAAVLVSQHCDRGGTLADCVGNADGRPQRDNPREPILAGCRCRDGNGFGSGPQQCRAQTLLRVLGHGRDAQHSWQRAAESSVACIVISCLRDTPATSASAVRNRPIDWSASPLMTSIAALLAISYPIAASEGIKRPGRE